MKPSKTLEQLQKENDIYKKNIEYHKNKITEHWMVSAYEMMKAGDSEKDTLKDFGYVTQKENDLLREGIGELISDITYDANAETKKYYEGRQQGLLDEKTVKEK